MKKKNSLIIFTDLDGTLLHRETFKFDPIKDYIKELSVGSDNQNINPSIIKGFLIVAAVVVAFIIFNEFYALLSGKALVG